MISSELDFPSYSAGVGLANGHLQSILPSLLRRVTVPFERFQLELDDGDFLLVDSLKASRDNAPLVILSHGLEGNSHRHYIQGMARHFHQAGWHVLAWNFRGCGGLPNRLPRFYHSGAYEDLRAVIRHGLSLGAQQIVLVGFSMGGNQTLLTLAQPDLEPEVIGGVGFSVPLDLAACADALARPAQRLYMQRFLRDLKGKIAEKAERFPELISLDGYDRIRNFKDFDDRYTAPLHGYRSAEDYWHRCSSGRALSRLQRPALVVNALDDPFLAPGCYRSSGRNSPNLHMESPLRGGHCGFMRWRLNQPLWSEQRALSFAQALLQQMPENRFQPASSVSTEVA